MEEQKQPKLIEHTMILNLFSSFFIFKQVKQYTAQTDEQQVNISDT